MPAQSFAPVCLVCENTFKCLTAGSETRVPTDDYGFYACPAVCPLCTKPMEGESSSYENPAFGGMRTHYACESYTERS